MAPILHSDVDGDARRGRATARAAAFARAAAAPAVSTALHRHTRVRPGVDAPAVDPVVDATEAYRRFVAAAAELERGQSPARDDLMLIDGVRREYARLFARAIDYADVAASVLRTGQVYEADLTRAVETYLRSRVPAKAAVARTSAHTSLDEFYLRGVQKAYLQARVDPSSFEDTAFVRGVNEAYGRIHLRAPPSESLFLREHEDNALMMAVELYEHELDQRGIHRQYSIREAWGEPDRIFERGGNSKPSGSSRCFTGRMRVATPSGPRAIAKLAVGDTVYSYDLAHRRVVISYVTRVRCTPGRAFGILRDLAVPIEVTGEHRFYSGAGRYDEVAVIESSRPVFGLPEMSLREGNAVDLVPRVRGCYVRASAPETVTELSLGEGPHNYFVEGILVHNVKVSF